jgi:clorobiocin biosynthesis protein CloN6
LMHPSLRVEALIKRLHAPVFGFDLHWMPQCHGAIELADKVKAAYPESLVIFGGISATYFARELITYPSVDVVVQGYDTLDVVAALMRTVRAGSRDFARIPNLLYKKAGREVEETGFTLKRAHDYNDATVDWSYYREAQGTALNSRMIMTLPNTGCAHDCPWCGGSRYAYRNFMGVKKTLVTKNIERVVDELRSLGDAAKTTAIYALQCYSENQQRLYRYLDTVREMGYKEVYFEQFRLPSSETVKKMAAATRAYIMLSPESHDPVISKLSGRGAYTMNQMEEWIERALDQGIAGVFVWFVIGMPQQDRASVLDTVRYAEALLRKFKGRNVLPLVCPMVPFLDPGSRFFEHPAENGYRIFHRTLAEHRRAMVAPLWHQRLNYETKWLSRTELQDVTYEAIARMITVKAEHKLIPPSWCKRIHSTINETIELLSEMQRAHAWGQSFSSDLRSQILTYNRRILAYSSDQIVPTPRAFGGRWFDDATVPAAMIEEITH